MTNLFYILWNPSLTIGPIRWYSLCWLIGLALAYLVVKRLYQEQKIKDELFDPLFVYCFVGILVGARLGHCIFYQPDYFLTSGKGFVEMLLPIHFMHDGSWRFTGYEGLASHGGTLGLMIALWLYVRKTKLSIWTVLDNIAIATGTTACFIRLGNLMNSEIIGRVTDVPWAFIFERVDSYPRHPGQLYEAIAYAVLFGIMWWIYKRSLSAGEPQNAGWMPKVGTGWYFGFCLFYIFTFRFFIEYTKEIQEAFEASLPLDMGQILSIPFIIIGVACMIGGQWMKRLMTVALLVTAGSSVQAQQTEPGDYQQRYYQAFGSDDAEAFYQVSNEAKQSMLNRGDRQRYYVLAVNEVNYEVRQNHTSKALKRASEVLREMTDHQDGRFDLIYNAMGNIYEKRGNYKMARIYNQKAVDNVQPGDTVGMIGAYISIANLEAAVHSDESIAWTERLLPLCKNYPDHYKYALTIRAMADFFKNDSEAFYETLDEFNIYSREHNLQEGESDKDMKRMKAAFEGRYQEALGSGDDNNGVLLSDVVRHHDLYIQVYRMMGDKDMVMSEMQQKMNAIDSLNADLVYEHLNEMNAEMELSKTEEKAAKDMNVMLAIVVALLVIVVGLLLWRYLTRRGLQKELISQNKELEVALKRAEESDRMKTSFIEHVSHEIRTPLNVITGFAQIISNPDYEVTPEDRNRMLGDISKNTIEITDIVNELLEVAQDESREHYEKTDQVAVNAMCQQLIDRIKPQNRNNLQIDFITDLTDDYQMHTNRQAVEKILRQLLENALKFTKEGTVEVYVHETPDHGTVRFIISDTGIGIAEENQERIFERFFKVDNFKQGFGLGLTMSRKIALLLDGSLYLDKEYKKGARFILSLPA